MSKKHIRRIIIAVLAMAMIAAVIVLNPGRQQSRFTEETARTQDIRIHYTFSGNVEPDSSRVVTASNRGTVKEWKFAEGDKVEEDDAVLLPKSGSRYDAPMDGTISDLYVDEGDDYLPGDALFRVADYDHPIVKIKVDEYDVSALSRGMSVDVKIQATGAVLTGEITRIAQEATVNNDLAYYEVEIALPQDGTLSMGLTCEVSVLRASVSNATTVSVGAIQYSDDGKPYVYCYSRGNEVVRQNVLLGINNGSIVEIVDGVKSGETILIPPSNAMMMPMMRMMNHP